MIRGHVVTHLTLVYVGVGLLQFPQHPGRKGWRFSNHVSRFWKKPVISYSKTMVDHREGFTPGHFREFVGWWHMITSQDDCMIIQILCLGSGKIFSILPNIPTLVPTFKPKILNFWLHLAQTSTAQPLFSSIHSSPHRVLLPLEVGRWQQPHVPGVAALGHVKPRWFVSKESVQKTRGRGSNWRTRSSTDWTGNWWVIENSETGSIAKEKRGHFSGKEPTKNISPKELFQKWNTKQFMVKKFMF